jgi:hypothetical protein
MRRTTVLGALALSAMLLSGCTLVPTASQPQTISPSHVPFSLLNKTIPGTNNGHVHFKTQPVYIVDATGHLAPSSRIVASPVALDSVLRQLVIGPTKIEGLAGYTSALPKNLVILSAVLRNGIGDVDIATSFGSMPRRQQVLAIGQLVLTAHDVAGDTQGIEISVAGVLQLSPLPDGHDVHLVTPGDFQRLLDS